MLNGIFPIFTKGRVLKKESVEYLRDFPNDLALLAYGDYSDGILFGFTVSYESGNIIVSKGAIKHQEEIIIIPQNAAEITEYGRLLYIELVIGELTQDDDYKYRKVELHIDSIQGDGVELGRFCLNKGANLRLNYDSFSDLRTPENTLDLTRVAYAGLKNATLHPRILQEYAKILISNSDSDSDISFSLMCLNAGIIHKDVIQHHIAKKTGENYTEYTLNELYTKLEEIVSNKNDKPKIKRERKIPTII